MGLWARQGITGVAMGMALFAVLFVPIVVWQYRRFGRFSWPRLLGAGACALFATGLVAYTLLPLPVTTPAWCAEHAITHAELVPGNSLQDAAREISGLSLGQALRSRAVLQIVFNVVLFMPLGVILRRYFGRSVLAATVIGAGVSVLIELTQYTGIWGLTGCAYRLADVDDVIANTLGALIGALVAPAVLWWMPTARRLRADRSAARPVTGGRRMAGMVIDLAVFAFIGLSGTTTYAIAMLIIEGPATGPGDRSQLVEWVLGVVVPFVIVALVPALTPAGASIGQRVVWLRPDRPGGLGPGRRLLRMLGGTLPVVVLASMVLLDVGGGVARGYWMLALLASILVIAGFAVVDREHRGVSGRLAGIRYVDVRANRDPLGSSTCEPLAAASDARHNP